MLKHYVTFLVPSLFFAEQLPREISDREAPVNDIPNGAFAYYFFDLDESANKPKNVSSRTYLGGQVYSLEQVKEQFPEYKTLILNMENNKLPRVILTPTGNWYPFAEGDIVLS